MSAQPHSCCELEAALPKAAEELQVGFTAQELSSGKLGKLVGGLSKYCIACHRQEGQATPWLLGSYDQAEARIRHCADRLLFRLKMNEAPDRTSRPAGAMPLKLQSVLDNLSVRPDQWELDRRALVDSLSEISPFAAAVRARSNSDDSRDGFQKKLLDEMISGGVRGYDSLPACLESGGGKP